MTAKEGGAEIGKEAYLKDLMKKYGQLVYTICLRNCGNPFDAEDLMQETFLAVYKNLDTYNGEKEQAWICKIALNKCLDFLKSTGRRQIPMEDVAVDIDAGEAVLPEQIFLQRESEHAVRRLCESLKAPYASVAVAHFCEEKTAREIAESTGKGLKTVQTQIYRAKAMLKNKLERSQGSRDG
jgi:RNA polymerase sigma-70 factor (ECF subfamily)